MSVRAPDCSIGGPGGPSLGRVVRRGPIRHTGDRPHPDPRAPRDDGMQAAAETVPVHGAAGGPALPPAHGPAGSSTAPAQTDQRSMAHEQGQDIKAKVSGAAGARRRRGRDVAVSADACRDPEVWFRRCVYDMSNETCVHGKIDLFVWQKRPVCMANETYVYGKRDLLV